MCMPQLEREGLILSASKECRHLPVKMNRQKKEKTKTNNNDNKKKPTLHPKFPLDKQAREVELFEETIYCSVTRELGYFHVLLFCNSSRKLKTFIFFRCNLCTWRLSKKDLKIPLLLKIPFFAGPAGPPSCLTSTVNLSLDFNNNI